MASEQISWGKVKEELMRRLVSEGIEVEGNDVPQWLEDAKIYDLATTAEMLRSILAEDGTLIEQAWTYIDEEGWYYSGIWRINYGGREYYVAFHEEPYYLLVKAYTNKDDAKRMLSNGKKQD